MFYGCSFRNKRRNNALRLWHFFCLHFFSSSCFFRYSFLLFQKAFVIAVEITTTNEHLKAKQQALKNFPLKNTRRHPPPTPSDGVIKTRFVNQPLLRFSAAIIISYKDFTLFRLFTPLLSGCHFFHLF